MAETVLYLLNSTDDSTRIAIQPRTFDGVGGVQRNTDLTLYGNGAPNWGERFDENFYHLLENFAVQEKVGILPITPQDETDLLTVGLGVNNPIEGQIWFNKDRRELFVYDGDDWKPGGKVAIVNTLANINSSVLYPSPRTGELAFATDQSQLYVYNGSTWVTSTPAATGVVPTSRAINTTGSLTGGGNLTIDRTLSLVNDNATPGNNRYYGTNGSGTKGFFALPSAVTSVNAATSSTGLVISGGPITTTGTLTFTLNGELQALAGLNSTGILKRFGIANYLATTLTSGDVTTGLGYTPVNRAGDSMSGFLTLNANPTNAFHAATKQYVDNSIASLLAGTPSTDIFGSTGYIDIPILVSGVPRTLIIQWGNGIRFDIPGGGTGVVAGTTSLSYAKTFPNAVFQTVASARGLPPYAGVAFQLCVRDDLSSNSGFVIRTSEDAGVLQNMAVTYIAIGW